MTKEDIKMYDQIIDSFEQIEVTEDITTEKETVNTNKTEEITETTKAYIPGISDKLVNKED